MKLRLVLFSLVIMFFNEGAFGQWNDYFNYGKNAYQNSNYTKAIDDFGKSLKLAKNQYGNSTKLIANLNYWLGLSYAGDGQFPNAEAHYIGSNRPL